CMFNGVQEVRVFGFRWSVTRVPSARTRPQTNSLKELAPFVRVADPSGRHATVVASNESRSWRSAHVFVQVTAGRAAAGEPGGSSTAPAAHAAERRSRIARPPRTSDC